MARHNGQDRGLFERPTGSGIWWIRYHDAQGREHREKVGPKSLARQAYQKRKTQVREGQFFPGDLVKRKSMLIADFIQEYLIEAKLYHRAFHSDLTHARTFTKAFGKLALDELTTADVEKWKRERLALRSKATVCRDLAWLKRLFTVAMRDDKVRHNPALPVKLPKLNNARVRFLSETEETAVMRVMDPYDFEVIELAINTGLRRSELFNWKWTDTDFRNGVVTINRSKSGERRYVALNARVLEILRSRQKRFKSEYVIPGRNPLLPANAHSFVTTVFVPALKLAGVHNFRFHDCRHTFASRLIMAGVNLRTVQELMGHKTIQMTLRYAHLAPAHLKEAVNRLCPKSE